MFFLLRVASAGGVQVPPPTAARGLFPTPAHPVRNRVSAAPQNLLPRQAGANSASRRCPSERGRPDPVAHG